MCSWPRKRERAGIQTQEKVEGVLLKRVNWVFIVLVLIGFVIGRFIGTYFSGSFLNYGQTFGLSSPIVLDLGFIILTFGLQIQITIASVIGVAIALLVYRFIR
ncbi:MAG: DUF4321 domain-containing protein [Acetatifactor sp.]